MNISNQQEDKTQVQGYHAKTADQNLIKKF